MEVIIVATRRVELLRQCLASFSEKLFAHFEIERALINIDPIWGSEADQKAIKALMSDYFENVKIIEPNAPHFSKAVKTLWLETKANRVFHLEEDWIALEDITPEMVDENLKDNVKSLSLMNAAKNNKKGNPYHYRRYRPWYLPFKIEDRSKPYFGTSPSFWCGDFMRDCAKRMDIAFDPEKQFYENFNSELEAFVKDSKCKFLFGNPHLIQDIGREWQVENNVEKSFSNGATIWTADKKSCDA